MHISINCSAVTRKSHVPNAMSSSYGDENSRTSALQKTSSDQVFPKPTARRLSETTEFLFPEFTDFCSSPTSVTQTSPSSARSLCKAGQLRPARLQQEPEIQLCLLSRYLPSDQRQPAAPPAALPRSRCRQPPAFAMGWSSAGSAAATQTATNSYLLLARGGTSGSGLGSLVNPGDALLSDAGHGAPGAAATAGRGR